MSWKMQIALFIPVMTSYMLSVWQSVDLFYVFIFLNSLLLACYPSLVLLVWFRGGAIIQFSFSRKQPWNPSDRHEWWYKSCCCTWWVIVSRKAIQGGTLDFMIDLLQWTLASFYCSTFNMIGLITTCHPLKLAKHHLQYHEWCPWL